MDGGAIAGGRFDTISFMGSANLTTRNHVRLTHVTAASCCHRNLVVFRLLEIAQFSEGAAHGCAVT